MNNTLLYLVSLQCDFITKLSIRQCNKYLRDRIKLESHSSVYHLRVYTSWGMQQVGTYTYKTIHRAMYHYLDNLAKNVIWDNFEESFVNTINKINQINKMLRDKDAEEVLRKIENKSIGEKELANMGKKRLMEIKTYFHIYQAYVERITKIYMRFSFGTVQLLELELE